MGITESSTPEHVMAPSQSCSEAPASSTATPLLRRYLFPRSVSSHDGRPSVRLLTQLLSSLIAVVI
jgi:hypothetical protein